MIFDDSDPLPVGSNVTEGACETMPRLTITLADRTHRALKKAAHARVVPCPQLLKRAWK